MPIHWMRHGPSYAVSVRFSLDEGCAAKLVSASLTGVIFSFRADTGKIPRLTRRNIFVWRKFTLEESAGENPVLAGAAATTLTSLAELDASSNSRANGLLSVTPFTQNPQGGTLPALSRDRASTRLPIVLYNVPGRLGTNLSPPPSSGSRQSKTSLASRKPPEIFSDVSAPPTRTERIHNTFPARLPSRCPLFATRWRGAISVAANEIPAEMAQALPSRIARRIDRARTIHRKYLPLMEINFVESNPIPVKASARSDGPAPNRLALADGTAKSGESNAHPHVLIRSNLSKRSSVAVASIPH